jgi:hypothetical protein
MEIKLNNNTIINIVCNKSAKDIKTSNDRLFEAIVAWRAPICGLVQERLLACKNNLVDNLSRIDFADEYIVCYHTKSGNSKHYSAPAAQAMQFVIDNVLKNPERVINNHMCLLQIVKSLYRASNFTRDCVKDGYSFDDVYSLILSKLIK